MKTSSGLPCGPVKAWTAETYARETAAYDGLIWSAKSAYAGRSATDGVPRKPVFTAGLQIVDGPHDCPR